MMKLTCAALPITLALLLSACGSDGGGSSSTTGGDGGSTGSAGQGSGRDPNAQAPAIAESSLISELPSGEIGQLCDWFAEMAAGGYEQVECSDGVFALPTSGNQENCIMNTLNNNSGCASSVGDWIACAKKLAAPEPCDGAGITAGQNSDECSNYYFGTGGNCFNIN